MSKICIDARFYGITHTGIGRYVQNLIKNISSDVILIINAESADLPELKPFKKYIATQHPYSLLSQFEMYFLLKKIKPDLLHVPHFTVPIFWRGPLVITIHDLIKHEVKGGSTTTKSPLFYWPKYLAYLFLVKYAVWQAKHIIVPTNYWKDKLVNKFNLTSNKVSVTYEGIESIFLKNTSAKSLMPKTSLVYTGNLYPHKNVSTLIQAVDDLGLHLNIVCARSVFETRLKKSPHVTYLGRLTDQELISLYSQSMAFVFPSFVEGFGLPGLEAMATGLPVISSNSTCLPEVYGEAALYFDPANVEDLKSKIKLLLSDESLRTKLIKTGYTQVKKYSWIKMSQQTWTIYQNALH